MLAGLISLTLILSATADGKEPPTVDAAMVSAAVRLPSQLRGRWLLLPFNEVQCGRTLLGRQVAGVLKSALSDLHTVDLIWELPPGVVLAEAAPEGKVGLDDRAAIEAGRAVGAAVVLVGALARSGATWDVEIRLLRVEDGDTLFATPVTFATSKVLDDAAGLLSTSPERRCARAAAAAAAKAKRGERTLVGHWLGIGTQNSGTAWSMDVRIASVTPGRCAEVVYPGLHCSAYWECQGDYNGQELKAREMLVSGRDRCIDRGDIKMYLAADGETLLWNWILESDAAAARLKRAPPAP